jgi:hypothetical protein
MPTAKIAPRVKLKLPPLIMQTIPGDGGLMKNMKPLMHGSRGLLMTMQT